MINYFRRLWFKNKKTQQLFEAKRDIVYLERFKSDVINRDTGMLRKEISKLKGKKEPDYAKIAQMEQEIQNTNQQKANYDNIKQVVTNLTNYIKTL